MVRQTGSKVCIIVLALTAFVVAKPSAKVESWASSSKPVFSRTIGPSMAVPGMSSITVPYKPKSSPVFPKFVDPAAMISKKMEMLKTLFGGLGPAMPVGGSPKYNPGYGSSTPLLAMEAPNDIPESKDVNEVDDPVVKDKIKRGASVSGSKSKFAPPKFNPFFPFGPKVNPFAPKVNPFAPKVNPFAPKINPFVPQINPFIPKVNPFVPKVNPFVPKVNPFVPNPNPFAPNYFPYSANLEAPAQSYGYQGFPPQQYGPQFYESQETTARRRRSITETGSDTTKALGPPPAYPGLAPIAEEPETPQSKLQKLYGPSTVPREALPSMFGPFGPFGPYAPYPMDPVMFITNKPSYMDAFLKNLATTAQTDITDSPVTEIPIPKSTIVPPNFWAPSSIIPAPGEYAAKVTTFLDKLFTSLALNKTSTGGMTDKTVIKRSLIEDPAQGKVLLTRSIEDIKNIAQAKDSIVDSIVSELGDLKEDMVQTLDDYIVYEKTLPSLGGSYKKPSKVVSPFAAFFAPPTSDPSVPFKQRMAVLSQVFDMLSGIQRNISLAIREAMMTTTDSPMYDDSQMGLDDESMKINDGSNVYPDPNTAAITAFNATLLDVIRSRLMSLDNALGNGFNKPGGYRIYSDDAATVKRDVEVDDELNPKYYEDVRDDSGEHMKRNVEMQMHQGYQSMPPGAIESVQAGGGAVPGHQGGGIKLLDSQYNGKDWEKSFDWVQYLNNQNEERKHHHGRH